LGERNEGWTWRFCSGDERAHYFRNGRALCKPIVVAKIDPTGDEIEEEQKCRLCRRILRIERARANQKKLTELLSVLVSEKGGKKQ